MGSIEQLHEFDQAVVDDFRVHEGCIPEGRPLYGKQLLLLTMSGVKPGRRRTVPLLYAIDGSAWIVAGSAGGRLNDPAWAVYLRRVPDVIVELPGTVFRAVAIEVAGADRGPAFALASKQMKNLDDHQRLVERQIPLFRLERSSSMDEEALR